LEFAEVPIGDLPLCSPDFNADFPAATALKAAVARAAAVIGASPGQIGTAVAQQSLRAVLSFCNARQMTAPEGYITFRPGLFSDDGEVTDESTAAFLTDFMQEFRVHIERVLTVLPRA
jgi:chromate reductase